MLARDVVSNANPNGWLCNRALDPTAQYCWGVCLEEDVLSTETEVLAGC